MHTCKHDEQRRRLIFATSAVGGLGAMITALPFATSLLPSQRALGAGAPAEVEIDTLQPGHMTTVEWRNKPAPDNLEVPPHRYLSASRLIIGDEQKA